MVIVEVNSSCVARDLITIDSDIVNYEDVKGSSPGGGAHSG